MSSVARGLVSEAEFLRLPESSRPTELVDGEVIMAPSPTYWHQEVLLRLVAALRTWAARQALPFTVAQAPLDVRFGPGRILQPDAMVFAEKLPRDAGTPLDRIPVLCIEVLSNDRAYDRITKRFVYAEAGVQEYWLVEPAGMVERRSGPSLARVEELTDELSSPLLPGFSLTTGALFE